MLLFLGLNSTTHLIRLPPILNSAADETKSLESNAFQLDGRHLYAALTCSPLIFYEGVAAIVYLAFFKFVKERATVESFWLMPMSNCSLYEEPDQRFTDSIVVMIIIEEELEEVWWVDLVQRLQSWQKHDGKLLTFQKKSSISIPKKKSLKSTP